MTRQSLREVSQFVDKGLTDDFSNSAYRSFETWFIFYKMDCHTNAKSSEKTMAYGTFGVAVSIASHYTI
jgi:hypothetical protein